jgi:AcrR family transcriptional regulator
MAKAKTAVRRQGNRRRRLLDAAAGRFFRDGYAAASMRRIAADAGMRASSIYYHFASKAELMAAVHEDGMARITAAVQGALETADGDPWERLETACAAHLGVLLRGGDVLQAVMREMPPATGPARRRVVRLRDDYEAIFTGLLDDLRLPKGVERHDLRLMLLGSMNWAHNWYKPGARSPETIARTFVRFLRARLDGG